MRIERTTHQDWLSNTYLVAAGGCGVFIDTGADVEPLLHLAERDRIEITHVIATHRHPDHILNNTVVLAATGADLVAHEKDADAIGGVTQRVSSGEIIETGSLRIKVLHIPGHTAGQIALLVNETELFTGDTLFKGSIGGCVGPGHTTFDDLRHSIMDVLMALPHETRVYPGHTDPTTIGDEWNRNPFIRIMRGEDPEGRAACVFGGSPATLILEATDYDGGTKAWVRTPEMGDLVVPGSAVRDQPS
ncbi:MAG: MBL fold metallo-hydrolase [Gemmatimonadetes bacterium]|nr:MBL fold metallo-hydrolase [Gemmatimonadota bacterium]